MQNLKIKLPQNYDFDLRCLLKPFKPIVLSEYKLDFRAFLLHITFSWLVRRQVKLWKNVVCITLASKKKSWSVKSVLE